MTNMAQMRELDGIKASAAGEEIQEDLQNCLRQIALWSLWAAGLVESLEMVMPMFLQEQKQQPVLQKLDREEWKTICYPSTFLIDGTVGFAWKPWDQQNLTVGKSGRKVLL